MVRRWRLGALRVTLSRGTGARRYYLGIRYGLTLLVGHWAILIRTVGDRRG